MTRKAAAPLVGVVGLGHVGLSTAVSFASRGIMTVGLDIDSERLQKIGKGKNPFAEELLPQLLPKVVRKGKLKVTNEPSALTHATHLFITVQTPSSQDGSIDLSFVRSALTTAAMAVKANDGYMLIVLKSTVTPGTATEEALPKLESLSGKKLGEFGLASNPEFLREGRGIEDTLRPDRLVIGTEDGKSARSLTGLYRAFYKKLPATILTTTVNAELIKYASNAFLATKVSYVNELADLCSRLPGADVTVVARGMGLDSRIAPGSLKAGLGYGGSCLPKDVSALLRMSENAGVKLGIVAAADERNRQQAMAAVRLAEGLIGDLRDKRVAVLGLAFKPDSDDMRDAVSLRLISALAERGSVVVAFDPGAADAAKKLLGDRIAFTKSAVECLEGADCCILVTEWKEFPRIRPAQFKALMRTPAVVDGRRAYSAEQFLGSGVKYAAVGLGARHELGFDHGVSKA